MSKKNKELTPEVIARFEKATGAKIVDVGNGDIENLVIEYKVKRWRPIKHRIEVMCAFWDNEPILMLGNTQWIGENWKP